MTPAPGPSDVALSKKERTLLMFVFAHVQENLARALGDNPFNAEITLLYKKLSSLPSSD